MERTDPSAMDGSAKLVGRLEFLRRNNVSPARNMVETVYRGEWVKGGRGDGKKK